MLCDKIRLYPDENTVLELIKQFKPLLKKYAFLLKYEDAYEDLLLFFIELLSKMSNSNISHKNDGEIVQYIATSIRNQYIKLSKVEKGRKYKVIEFSELSDGQMFYVESSNSYLMENSIDEMLPRNKTLTNWEYKVIMNILVCGISISDLAQTTKKSRQAVNQAKNRAIKKIRAELQL